MVRYAVVKAVQDALVALHRDGHTQAVRDRMAGFDDYNGALGLEQWLALEERYLLYEDLASRDVVSRAMTIEIRQGRGVGYYYYYASHGYGAEEGAYSRSY